MTLAGRGVAIHTVASDGARRAPLTLFGVQLGVDRGDELLPRLT
jgi:hypothetical protein